MLPLRETRGNAMRPLLLVLLWLLPSVAFAQDELITLPSAHSAPVTIKRLQEAIVASLEGLGHGVLLVFSAPPSLMAGGAGARPDHPISGPANSALMGT